MTRRVRAGAVAILGVAVLLRLAALGRGEMWHDECGSVLMTTFPEGVWKAAAVPGNGPDGGNPPLYYALLDAWTALFGISAPAVRSLSLVLSVAGVAALGPLALAAGGSGGAALAAMALAAVSPLHVFYGTEARAYALLLLLLTIALTFFFRGMRSGRKRDWAAHGAALLLGWYSHNLAVPFTAAFWIAGAALRTKPRDWRAMLAAHGIAAVLYAPWIPVLLAQVGGGAHEWIRVFWNERSPLLLVPRTMEAMFVGGKMPVYLSLPVVPGAVRTVSTLLLLVASAGIILHWRAARGKDTLGPRRAQMAALFAFLFVPLLFLLAYSILKAPLYLVGRYDLPAYPAFAVLAGIGLEQILRHVGGARRASGEARDATAAARGSAGAGVLIAAGVALAILAFFSLQPYLLHPALSPRPGAKAARGELLAAHLRHGDIVVCTGFTTSETWYQLLARKSPAEIVTYPPALRSHLGWYDPEHELERGEDALRAEAHSMLARAAAAPSGANASSDAPKLWLVAHASPGRGAHARIMEVLLEEIERAGLRVEFPSGQEEEAQRLGVATIARTEN